MTEQRAEQSTSLPIVEPVPVYPETNMTRGERRRLQINNLTSILAQPDAPSGWRTRRLEALDYLRRKEPYYQPQEAMV